LLLLSLLGCLLSTPAEAARWDPRYRWHSLDTPHFSIHFHQGEAELASELALVAEEVHALLVPKLDWKPFGRTQVVLVDPTDAPNGYASTVPYNAVVLYVTPPDANSSLGNHEHWLWALFVHEYTHILQIDMVGGIPQVLRWIFGRLIVPGAVLPSWLTEGYATYIETTLTRGGRGRSTMTDAVLRTAALDGVLPRVDQADGFGQLWPRGQIRYLYGARFHLHVAEQTSDDAWVDFHKRHARGIIPLLLPAKKAFGKTLARMWKDWREELSLHYLNEAERIAAEGSGMTPTRVLPSRSGVSQYPLYSPDGERVLYVHSSPRERSSLRELRRDGSGDSRVRKGAVAGPTWSADGRHLYGAAVGSTNRYVSYRDLYRYDIASGKRKRVTRGARLTQPTAHPSGGWLIAVQNRRSQSQLVRVELSDTEEQGESAEDATAEPSEEALQATQGTELEEVVEGREQGAIITPITAARDGSQFSKPSFDPSGERLAVSIWKPGGFRDIHVLDGEGRELRVLSWDRASDADPCWSPDGQWLLWSSDRDGIWNLYAHRWSDGAVFRVTRVIGGARHPHIAGNGEHIVFQSYSSAGWRLEELPFEPTRWEPAPIPARALPGPDFGPSAQAKAPLSPVEGLPGPSAPFGNGPDAAVARAQQRDDYRSLAPAKAISSEPDERQNTATASDGTTNRKKRKEDLTDPGPREDLTGAIPEERGRLRRYNPLRTLLPPRYLALYGAATDTGWLGGVTTGGSDVLSQHGWAASLHYRTDSRFLGWGASYTLNAFHPVFSINYSNLALDYGPIWLNSPGPKAPGGTRFHGSYRGDDRYFERRDRLSVGASIPVRLNHSLSIRYKLEFRQPLRDLPTDVQPELLPARGSFSGLVLGWSTGRGGRYAASISPENAGSLSVRASIESSFLGAYRTEEDGSKSSLHRAIITARGERFITLPWARNHVLAMRFALGATVGTTVPQRSYRIGGPYGENPYVSLPDRYYALRGYPTSFMRGDHLYLGTVEYRMPLFYLERGLWTAPVFLRSVALAVFAEAAQAFNTEDYASYSGSPEGFLAFWSSTRPSFGVELVGDAVIGWGAGIQGRIGYAIGVGNGALPGGSVYAQLGASF